ncbi:WD40 repeat domain-containing protein [Micromonospora sp. LAH09]|uniref:WD40 repeat domain-containing protein n=1 Tax=Micromonospora cabrerizensis TaxID=2911213 RepID=UPI001EE94180|nr:WD40 repeat domain-containing protein [Micromonospora cabrerizensis]MCG5471441.1 WD40 repeat domain-containing protein [Micromonospora cabrerizensis]
MTSAPTAPWTVAIHAGAKNHGSIGAGFVIDSNLILTCEHVAFTQGDLREDLWISFPKAGVAYWDRRKVRQCLHNARAEQHLDLVLLELVEPVPTCVAAARLRVVPGETLTGKPWWAYGFPQDTEGGRAAHGRVGDEGGWGRVRLTSESDPGVAKGFSGTGLWSPDYEAVVGILLEADAAGHGQALTFAHVDTLMPELKLTSLARWRAQDADDAALAAWGWTLTTDDEARRHWLPRGRGVSVATETGSRFRGREVALRRLTAFLGNEQPAGQPLIVTGSPGVGKSAVLGRIVSTADATIRETLPASDSAWRATVGSVSCAVHAKGKSALDVATEVARAAGVGLPERVSDLLPALRGRLAGRPTRFNLVVDALDETSSPEQARLLIDELLLPLARSADVGAQVVVGSRRADDHGNLLSHFGDNSDLIDLDAPEFFAQSDLVDYACATLQLRGAERPGNPYADETVAAPVARRIAELANGNFLVAGLVARARALRDTVAIEPSRVSFSGTIADALDTYLTWLPGAGLAPARLALTALAYAESPGLPLSLWQIAVAALDGFATEAQLGEFARTSAANFLVETGGAERPAYRLFHQALNDALLAARADVTSQAEDERRLFQGWSAIGRESNWATAPDYLLRSLPGHAARAGCVDDVLADDDYLLHARLDRLLRVTGLAQSTAARARTHLLQRTPAAIGAAPAERAALFSVVDKLDGLQAAVSPADAPYQARWARTPPRQERGVLEGHAQGVYDVCPINVAGRTLLASAGEDGTVRFWDPLTNQSESLLSCHDDRVRSMCTVRVGGELLLATASDDGSICVWDPHSGQSVHTFHGHNDWVRGVCAVPLPAGDLLASVGDDRTVRVWDPGSGTLRHTLTGHTGWATAVTHLPLGGPGMLASAGFDGSVRLWDPTTGEALATLSGHSGWVTTLCTVRDGARTLLASAGHDGMARLWDPVAGRLVREFTVSPGPVTDLCTIDTGGVTLLACTREDGVISLWDVASGVEHPSLRGHASWIRAVCELSMTDRKVLATAGDDGTIRLWNPDAELPDRSTADGQVGRVTALCTIPMGGERLLASGGSDGSIRLWDSADGTSRGEFHSRFGPIHGMSPIGADPTLLVTGHDDGSIRLWDTTPTPKQVMGGHSDPVNAICVIDADDGQIVASAGDDKMVRLWMPATGALRDSLPGHPGWLTALTVVTRQGRQFLVSADDTGTIRLWDSDGSSLWQQRGHHDAVRALCVVTADADTMLVSGGEDGTIRLSDPTDGRPIATLSGHTAAVTAVRPMPYGDREIMASTSLDCTVRLWDPQTHRLLRSIPVRHPALTCHFVEGTLVVGLEHGLLALTITDHTRAGWNRSGAVELVQQHRPAVPAR